MWIRILLGPGIFFFQSLIEGNHFLLSLVPFTTLPSSPLASVATDLFRMLPKVFNSVLMKLIFVAQKKVEVSAETCQSQNAFQAPNGRRSNLKKFLHFKAAREALTLILKGESDFLSLLVWTRLF